MLGEVLLTAALATLGLPKGTLGDPHVPPRSGPTELLTRQLATAPVEKVERGAVVLERPGAPLRVEVDEHTPILVGERRGSLGDLAPGEEVRVSYDAVRGPPHANWIQVLPSRRKR